MNTAHPEAISDALHSAAEAGVLLLATDFDGTIAPFMDDPMAVRPLSGAVEALTEAAGLHNTVAALVSGRDLATLEMLSGAPSSVALIGSHGGESTHPAVAGIEALTDAHLATLDRLAEVFEELRQTHPSARIERKAAAVVWHTRGLPEPDNARALAEAAKWALERCGVEPMFGKDVVECAVLDVSKGHALRTLATALEADAVVYLGDDLTDETVFTEFSDTPGALMVKIGEGDTAAPLRLPGPEQAVETIARLVQLRRAVAARHA